MERFFFLCLGGPQGDQMISSAAASEKELRDEIKEARMDLREETLEKESLGMAYQERTQMLLWKAKTSFEKGENLKALQYAQQIRILDPLNSQGQELLSRITEKERDKKEDDRAFSVLEDETPSMSPSEKKEAIGLIMDQAEALLAEGYYDEAVEELENVFQLEPDNTAASKKIDLIREMFLKEKKQEIEEKAAAAKEELADRKAYSLASVKRLMAEENWFEAKIMLNRLAYLEPGNRKIRRLMEEVQKKEKESGKRAA